MGRRNDVRVNIGSGRRTQPPGPAQYNTEAGVAATHTTRARQVGWINSPPRFTRRGNRSDDTMAAFLVPYRSSSNPPHGQPTTTGTASAAATVTKPATPASPDSDSDGRWFANQRVATGKVRIGAKSTAASRRWAARARSSTAGAVGAVGAGGGRARPHSAGPQRRLAERAARGTALLRTKVRSGKWRAHVNGTAGPATTEHAPHNPVTVQADPHDSPQRGPPINDDHASSRPPVIQWDGDWMRTL